MPIRDVHELPALRHRRVVIPPARIATLFSQPVTLVHALSDQIIVPTLIHVRKRAGTAWTSGGSGTLQVGYPAATLFAQFDQGVTTTFFDAPEAVWVAGDHPTSVDQFDVTRLITSAEIKALNTTPIELVPAVAGIAYLPRKAQWYHAAGGTAYDITGVTGVQTRSGTQALTAFNGIGFLDSNAQQFIQMLGPGHGSALFSGSDLNAILGQNLNVFIAGANPTLGTFDVVLKVIYEKYPIPQVGVAALNSFAGLGITTGTHLANGAPVVLRLSNSDVSGGTGNLEVNVWFHVWAGLNREGFI